LNTLAAGKMMGSNFPRHWMWSEAIEMLDRAERLHREMFRPARAASRVPTSEPPIDVMETESAVIVLVALPGVEPGRIEVSLDRDVLSLSGTRSLPREFAAALIHRLELPQGRFERRVPLPPGGYAAVRSAAANGCLTIVLEKSGALGG
jgi:HSP20 family molecular chaperone IbpA